MRPSSLAASACLVLILVPTRGAWADQKEMSEVSHALRGVWTGLTVSKDQGKTSSPITPIRLATVSATTVKNQQGVESKIEKILEVREPGTDPVTLLRLPGGVAWIVSQKKEPGAFMLQIVKANPPVETIRFGFSIAPEAPRAVAETPRLLRGVWTGVSVSKDQGKTVEPIAPIRLATLYPNRLRGQKGDVVDVEKVVESKNDAGEKVHILRLSNGAVYVVTERKEPGAFILQTMAGEPLREVLRFGFTIRPEKTRDLRETPAELRGVWTARRASKDGGKTEDAIAPTPLATVFATQARGSDGKMSDLIKITEMTEDEARPAWLLTLSNGVIWIATKTSEPGVYLLQVMRGDPIKEALRFEMTIESK